MFQIDIKGLTTSPAQTVTVTITLPTAIPPGDFAYYKCHNEAWSQLPSNQASLDATRKIITLTLTDGATPDDSDGLVNGQISDPGGPAISVVPPQSAGPVGGVVEPVNKLTVYAPYLAIFGIVAAVAIVVVKPWKKRET
jgi:hypothetical protein